MADVITIVRGVNVGPDHGHPHWSDGVPILIDDEVRHATEGWGGFVSGVPNSEEVDVCWYVGDGDISDAIEHSPDELVRFVEPDPAATMPHLARRAIKLHVDAAVDVLAAHGVPMMEREKVARDVLEAAWRASPWPLAGTVHTDQER